MAQAIWAMTNLLFICSQNRLRSPTAEQVFADVPGMLGIGFCDKLADEKQLNGKPQHQGELQS